MLRENQLGGGFEIRPIAKNQEKHFYVNPNISSVIENSLFTQMLCNHSLQAGHALNILYILDRINEMKYECGYQGNIYFI